MPGVHETRGGSREESTPRTLLDSGRRYERTVTDCFTLNVIAVPSLITTW